MLPSFVVNTLLFAVCSKQALCFRASYPPLCLLRTSGDAPQAELLRFGAIARCAAVCNRSAGVGYPSALLSNHSVTRQQSFYHYPGNIVLCFLPGQAIGTD